jgi:signal transduction histidine kinase
MSSAPLKLLVVDDDEGDRKQILRLIKRSTLSCDCTEATTMGEALSISEQIRFDCVIVDYHLPGQTGLEGIATMLRRDAFLPVVLTTGQGSERLASEAIKLGAMDYISKADLNADTIQPVLEGVIEQAEQNRKVAEQQTALTVFAKVLVHDLKAPLQSVLGFGKLIETFLARPDFDKEKVINLARRISEGASRMNALIDSLHAYTEADARPRIERVALSRILSDVLTDLDEVIRKSGARVSYQGLPDIDADPAQIGQLVQNLIANGIKYCKASTPEVVVDAEPQEDGGWRIEVRDNGIGIPIEQCSAIFEPFRRLHSQGEYDGTGLGLATCKKIAGQHGGTIWCRSEVGKGTSFFFTLPAQK